MRSAVTGSAGFIRSTYLRFFPQERDDVEVVTVDALTCADWSLEERAFGWSPQVSFEVDLGLTVGWYLHNRDWWEDVKSGECRRYIDDQYEGRAGQR
jgi:dTDP-D-glucose 4,6-dehydratase